MKKFIIFLFFFIFFQEIYGKICSGNGHKENKDCICASFWTGKTCETFNPIEEFSESVYNESNFYDWTEISLQKRVEKLYNILPDSNLNKSDPMFPENYTSFMVDNLSVTWNSSKEINSNSKLWDQKLNIREIIQGSLRNCYFFSVLASLLNINGGEQYIKDAIPYSNEDESIFVTRWFLFGRYIYVSVNDYFPTIGNTTYGAQISKDNFVFWAAILEKAWAKIWGSYKAITDTTEELLVSALTGTSMKKTIKMHNFIEVFKKKNSKLNQSYIVEIEDTSSREIILGKTMLNIEYLIDNHIFSILKISNLNTGNQDPKTIFDIYNTWNIDVPLNSIPNETEKTMEDIDLINDGKFFIVLEDILKYFERMTVYEPFEKYEMVSQQLFLNRDLETNFSINFKVANLKKNDKVYYYFNLWNIDFLDNQIQHFQIKDLTLSPAPLEHTQYLPSKLNEPKDPKIDVKSTYIGGYFSDKKNIEYTLNLTIQKYNYDVFDKVYLTFYAPNKIISFINIIKNDPIDICPNNCSSNGICNESTNTCLCNSTHTGKACSLLQEINLNPIKNNSTCDSNFSYSMSSNICKCLPGYELINNSCKLCSDDQDFSVKFVKENNQRLLTDHKEEILNKIEILNKNKYNNDNTYNKICDDYKNQCYMENLQAKCRKTCMVGSCFIPGAQSSCFVNGCFGRGLCSPRGFCIACSLGSRGTFCEILN